MADSEFQVAANHVHVPVTIFSVVELAVIQNIEYTNCDSNSLDPRLHLLSLRGTIAETTLPTTPNIT